MGPSSGLPLPMEKPFALPGGSTTFLADRSLLAYRSRSQQSQDGDQSSVMWQSSQGAVMESTPEGAVCRLCLPLSPQS